jgi:hypothetical protein
MSWQSSRSSGGNAAGPVASMAAVFAMLFATVVHADEPCNPIVDGTYCATQMPKNRGYVGSSSGMKPLDDYSRLVPSAAVGGSPGTLIGFSVQGSRSCFGLLRRSVCD